MAGFTCPFCSKTMVVNSATSKAGFYSFSGTTNADDSIFLVFYKCPDCEEVSIHVKGQGVQTRGINYWIRPKSLAKQYPDYIPKVIRDDYSEACLIVNDSPKASATLARRCLQGMIRDFWGVSGKENLKQEIDAIEGKVHPDQWKVIQAVRQLGNIGAHMEKDIDLIIDIDAGEAEKLIKLIELLMHDWYIRRFEQQQLYSDIIGINGEKQGKRSLSK